MSETVRVLISEEEVERRICEMGKEISEHYQGEPVHLVSVLKGGVFFTCDQDHSLRQIHPEWQIRYNPHAHPQPGVPAYPAVCRAAGSLVFCFSNSPTNNSASCRNPQYPPLPAHVCPGFPHQGLSQVLPRRWIWFRSHNWTRT